jgi:hypothetical protein
LRLVGRLAQHDVNQLVALAVLGPTLVALQDVLLACAIDWLVTPSARALAWSTSSRSP